MSIFKTLVLLAIASATIAVARAESPRKIYTPREFRAEGFDARDAKWSRKRCKESERCVVFWAKEFGDDPNSANLPPEMRVDVDELLQKAEQIYSTNVERLGFSAQPGAKSRLDEYKLQIYLLYRQEWLATGSGYDDVIGALWVNPSTCQPVGDVIAHELGHSFQYQIYCDQLANGVAKNHESGFRYAHDSGLGNTIWEQCAQWQAQQDYPQSAFTNYHKETWAKNCHRAFENEWARYQSYWLLYAIKDLRGIEAIANVWKASRRPEDFLDAYLRLYCNGDGEKLGDDLYYYASHAATFDFNGIREFAREEWIDAYRPNIVVNDEGAWQIAYASCPDESGFNAIPLDPKEYDGKVEIAFKALEIGSELAKNDPGVVCCGESGELIARVTRNYNSPKGYDKTRSQFRYGFVALCDDGTRVYGDAERAHEKTVQFKIPENATRLFFVVAAVADRHYRHKWDNDESNDLQLPYQISVRKAIQD